MSELTSISAGLWVYKALSSSEELMRLCGKVFPVVSEAGAQLPYVCYRKAANAALPVKQGRSSDAVSIEVTCYARTYAESVCMAEIVRGVLEGGEAEDYVDASGRRLAVACAQMIDCEEAWADDAYMQNMTFEIRIY